MLEYWDRLKQFFLHDLWEIDPRSLSRWRGALLRPVRIVMLLVHDFIADGCLMRASALTYTTLLSIIPLLALMFAVLKGFGVQNTLEPIILRELALGTEEIVTKIITYINNTNMGQLGAMGFAALLVTVLALLSNIEQSFNHIWGVEETRSLMRRFADYFSVVTVGPLLVFLAISMTSTLQNLAFVDKLERMSYIGEAVILLFKFVPFLGMWIVFTALNIFMPNCRVSVRAAVIGGIFGGTLWQLAQWSYVHFQVGVARYNAIYGTMAALPIFMVWIYMSWLIVLLGVELTFTLQNQRGTLSEIRGEQINYTSRELIALTVMLVLAEAFYRDEKGWDGERITRELALPPRLARSILNQLVGLGYLSEVRSGSKEQFAYQPGRPPDTLSVHELIQSLKGDGLSFTRMRKTPEREVIREIEDRLEGADRETLGDLTLKDLVVRMGEKARNGKP